MGVRWSARLCYPNFIYFVFPSFKNLKNARYPINASVQVSKIRYLSQGLARSINMIKTMIKTMITVLLCSAFR